MILKIIIFRDMSSCSYQCFGGIRCRYFQNRRILICPEFEAASVTETLMTARIHSRISQKTMLSNSKQSEADDHKTKRQSPVQCDACLLLPYYSDEIFLLLDCCYFLFPYHNLLFWFYFHILTSRIFV